MLPTGATVVKGSGSVSVNGADMTVNQSSQRLVTDWQSFSIGSGNSVRFVQPSSSAVALNRITGDDASNIFGSLSANGHVYLENANGVYFAPGAQVSVGSLLATSLNIDVGQFMLGNLRLSGGNEASGEVNNAGSINAAPGRARRSRGASRLELRLDLHARRHDGARGRQCRQHRSHRVRPAQHQRARGRGQCASGAVGHDQG